MHSTSTLHAYIRVLSHFLYRDLMVFFKRYKQVAINSLSWPLCTGLVFGYIMPELGLGRDFGGFVIVSTIVILMLYICFENAHHITSDIDGVRYIDTELILPISPLTIFVRHGLSMGIRAFFQSLPLPILSKLLLYYRFSFAEFSVFKFFLMNFLICLMFGSFATFIGGFVHSDAFFDFRIRVVDQMGFLGCFFFPWQTLYAVWPHAAWVNLLNPVTHAMESARVAFFGQVGSINFWGSCFMMVAFTALFFVLAVRAYKKRLDYVS